MNIDTISIDNGQGSSATDSSKKPKRARSMTDELKTEYGKILEAQLASSQAGSLLSLNEVREKFNCDSNVAHAIIRKASDALDRHIKVVEDVKNSTSLNSPKLTSKSVIIGLTYFDRENDSRSDDTKFLPGDEFKVEFSEDPDKVILTRVRRVAVSSQD